MEYLYFNVFLFIESYVKKYGIIDRSVEGRYFLNTNKDLYSYLSPFLSISESSLAQIEALTKLSYKVHGFNWFQSNIEVSSSRIIYQPFPCCSIKLENGSHTIIVHHSFIENDEDLENKYNEVLKDVSDIIYPKTKNFKELNQLLSQSTESIIKDKLKKIDINYISEHEISKFLASSDRKFYSFDGLDYFIDSTLSGTLKSKIKQQLSLMRFYFKIKGDPNYDTPVLIIFNEQISNVKDSNLIFEFSYGYRSNFCKFHFMVFDDQVKSAGSFDGRIFSMGNDNFDTLEDIYDLTLQHFKFNISKMTNTAIENITVRDILLHEIMQY